MPSLKNPLALEVRLKSRQKNSVTDDGKVTVRVLNSYKERRFPLCMI